MDLQHIPNVLPSNAPSHYGLVPGFQGVGSPSRVLQERCRNRQDEFVELPYQYPVKLSSPENTENRYQAAPHVNYHGHRNNRLYYNDEARKRKDAEKLWRSLLDCPAYRKYRNRQPTKTPNDGEQKWPERMERAFCEALVEHPPMGRRKQTMDHDPKPRGRNELIADYIQKLTGVERSRKQVSSHIQVMKPMVKDDPFILSYLSKPDQDGGRRHRAHSGLGRRPQVVGAYHNRHFHHPQPSRLASQIQDSFLPRAMKLGHDIDRKGSEGGYRPMLFEMYVADLQREPPSIIHKFTGFGDSPRLPDCLLTAERPWSWRTAFPPLAELKSNGLLRSQVVFCNATLALLPQVLPANAELRIQLEIETPQYVTDLDQLHCCTSFFDNGIFLEKNERDVSIDARYSRCQVSFGSHFWAAKTVGWQKALRNPDPEKRHQAELEVRDAVSRLSAVQEISYYPSASSGPQILLLVCWKFEQVRDNGVTTWRNVITQEEKQESREQLLMNRVMEQMSSSYPPDMVPTSSAFDQNAFDLGDLNNVAIPDLTPDLDATVVGAESFSANEIDFNGSQIQICMDSNIPVEAYAGAAHGFEHYHHEPADGGWATAQYPGVFDHVPHEHGGFEHMPVEHGKGNALVGHQHFMLGAMAQLRDYDIRLTKGDIESIKGDWLTDNAIAFWEEYLEREELKAYPRAHIVLLRPSMAFMLLNTRDPTTIKDALPNFSRTTHIFLPINDNPSVDVAEGGSHWSLLLVSTIDGVAFHYDSLSPDNLRPAQTAARKLSELLGIQLRFVNMDDTPQQENGSDCGVFVCLLMRHLLLNRLLKVDSNARVTMAMAGREVNAKEGRKLMIKIIENFRKVGERRRSRSASPFGQKHDRKSPPRIGDD